MADERVSVLVEILNGQASLRLLQQIQGAVNNLNGKKVSINVDTSSAMRSVTALSDAIMGLSDASKMTSQIAGSIGNAFSGMSDLFKTDFVSKAISTVTDMATRAFVGNMDSVVKRRDIMSTFTDYMELAGASATQAQEALDKVDQSIRGLPIGLDEAAQRLRRYQMFLGDLDRATNITIGVQKAITAGGANESAKNMAYYQLDRLLTAGELATTRQWYSLINGLGVSIRFLTEAMDVGDISVNELAAGLVDGTYSAEQLLDAFARLGEGTVESAQDLDRALGIYKTTFESWMSNIRFATIRGMTNVVNAVNDSLEDLTGVSITGYMEKTRDSLNEMYSSISAWITEHPEDMSRLVGSIQTLLGALSGFDASGMASSAISYLSQFFTILAGALRTVTGGDLERFAAFATTIAGPLGILFRTVASGLPLILAVFERFKNFNFGMLIDDILTQVERMAGVIEWGLNIFSDSALSNIIAFGLVWGAPLAKTLGILGGALKTFGVGLGTVATALPAAGAIGTTLFIMADALSKLHMRQDEYKDMFGITELELLEDQAEATRQSVEKASEARQEEMALADERAEKARDLIEQLKELDSLGDLDVTQQEKLRSLLTELSALYPDWGISVDSATTALDDNTRAILNNAEAAIAALKAVAAEEALQEIAAENLRLQIEDAALHSGRVDLYGQKNQINMSLEARRAAWQEIYSNDQYESKRTAADWMTAFETDQDVIKWQEQLGELDKAIADNDESIKEHAKALEDSNKEYEIAVDMTEQYRNEAANAASAAAQAQEEVAESAYVAADAIDRESEAWIGLRDAAAEAITSVFGGFGEYETPETVGWETLQTGMEERAEALESYRKNLETIKEFVDANSDNLGLAVFVSDLLQGGAASAGEIAGLAEQITTDGDAVIQAVEGFLNTHINMGETSALEADLQTILSGIIEPFTMAVDEAGGAADEIIAGTAGILIDGKADIEEAAETAADGMSVFAPTMRGYSEEAGAAAASVVNAAASSASAQGAVLVGIMAGIGAQAAQALTSALASAYATFQTYTYAAQGFNPHIPDFVPTFPNLWKGFAHGGVVYASNGQLIGFTPRGTDTIPAMLTPGEFVVRRGAVNSVGLQFLRSVNNLDLHAAYDALANRLQMPGAGGFITSNRDDHSSRTVNQYITNGGQHYSQRIASRWLHGI